MAMSRGKPLCQLVDGGFHALMSSKFDGSVEEQRVRAVNAELQTLNLKTAIVDATIEGTFGPQTDLALFGAHTAICFCSQNYGQLTESPYSSYEEVKYANNNKLNILPIQLCDTYPPAPDDKVPGGGKTGAAQNSRVFACDRIRIDGRGKTHRQIAIEIKNHLDKQIEASKAITAGYSTASAPVPYPAQTVPASAAPQYHAPPQAQPAQVLSPCGEAARRKEQIDQFRARLEALRREEQAKRKADFQECIQKPTVTSSTGGYTGQWKDNKWHGHGVQEFPTGERYEGQWVEDKREGFGKNTYADGNVYEGQYRADKKHGDGDFLTAVGQRYFGQYKDGEKDGHGVYNFKEGHQYDGEWKAGGQHGKGTMIDSSGNKRPGEWKDNKRISG